MSNRAGVIQGLFPHGGPRFTAAHVQRQIAPVQRLELPPHLANLSVSRGQQLPPAVRQMMEAVFQTSFADVRIHVGNHAPAIGAVAFTQGTNIYFAPGRYNPATPDGQRILGHELAHVVQQRTGRVHNPFGSGIAVVTDRALDAEAERMSHRVGAHAPLQLAKNKKAREAAKIEAKRTNKALNQSRKKGLGANTNTAVATGRRKGKLVTYHTRSGAIGIRGGVLHNDGHVFPWANLVAALPYPFINCAEAQMYLRIVEVGGSPADFTLTSYNVDGAVNPPCANCAQWVYATFGTVVDQ